MLNRWQRYLMGRAMRKVLASLLVVLLAACGTGVNGERYFGVQGSPMWRNTADPETIRAYYEEKCSIYGYKTETLEMDMCVERTITGDEESYRLARQKLAEESKQNKKERDELFNDLMNRQAERNRQRKEGWYD